MKRLSIFMALGAVILVATVAALNWSTLMAPAPLDLVVTQMQVPLGAAMLGLAGVLLALFLVAFLSHQIGSLLETRKLLLEIHRVQKLADTAEASRLEDLRQLIATEFRLLAERMNTAQTARSLQPVDGPAPGRDGNAFKPLSLTEIVAGRETR